MELQPGHAAVLIVRKSETNPESHFVAVRKAESTFDPDTNDFHFATNQEAVLEINPASPLSESLDKAILALKGILLES